MRDVDMEILEMCRRAKDPARAYKLAIELITEAITRSKAGESNENGWGEP